MNAFADKSQKKRSQSAATLSAREQKDGADGADGRQAAGSPGAVWQTKLQELADTSPRVKQLMAFQEMANRSRQRAAAEGLIQKADDSDEEDDHTKKEGGPLPILRKTGDGNPFTGDSLVEKIQLRGGHGAAHSEVFCTISGQGDDEGASVLRFSRNQGGDTFQRQAKLDQSSWEVETEEDVSSQGLTVTKAEALAQEAHDRIPRYISGDCHDFAYLLYSALQTGSLPAQQSEDDDLGW